MATYALSNSHKEVRLDLLIELGWAVTDSTIVDGSPPCGL